MNPNDLHYTPVRLASQLAELLHPHTTSVVDLAAGGGSLLDAAHSRGVTDGLVAAVDTDARAMRQLRRGRPDWVSSIADSLNPNSYRASLAYQACPAGYDGVLLNPPFSYRGSARRQVLYRGTQHRVSPASAFVATAFEWIRPGGVIAAILPGNVMNVSGDDRLWRVWRAEHTVEIVDHLDRYAFPRARTESLVVQIRATPPARDPGAPLGGTSRTPLALHFSQCSCVEIVRGRVPVHVAKKDAASTGAPFVHSTNIREGRLIDLDTQMPDRLSSGGPLVLLPRVGKPLRSKIAVAEVGSLVLSDCVYGLRTLNSKRTEWLASVMRDRFDEIAKMYAGSCAPYLTVARLMSWLERTGFEARHVEAGSSFSCACSNGLEPLVTAATPSKAGSPA